MHIEQLLDYMERIPGWFLRNEARLLQCSALDALMKCGSGNVVEIGSYCGKSTVMLADAVRNAQRGRVHAIDPDESLVVGVADIWTGIGKVAIFTQKIKGLGLEQSVTLLQKRPSEVQWSDSICFLHIDGLHDAVNVAMDFDQFFSHVEKGGYVAFHDYGNPYYPGVKQVVDAALESGKVRKVAQESLLIILEKS